MGEDADANAAMRATFRKNRKAKRRRLGDAGKMGLGKGIELLSEGTAEDEASAKEAMDRRERGSRESSAYARKSEQEKFRSVRTGSIFSSQSSSSKRKSSGGRAKTKDIANARRGPGRQPNEHECKKGPAPKQKIRIQLGISASDSSVKPTIKDHSDSDNDVCALGALACNYGSDSD